MELETKRNKNCIRIRVINLGTGMPARLRAINRLAETNYIVYPKSDSLLYSLVVVHNNVILDRANRVKRYEHELALLSVLLARKL